MAGAPIQVEGLNELVAGIRRADPELAKRIGLVHREIGAMVISRLRPAPTPAAVGRGSGASVRPSSTAREVLLRVGGSFRETRAQQWGRRQQPPFQDTPPRPYIVETARANQDEVEQMFLDGVERALKPPFQ